MSHIFISYSTKNSEYAYKLANKLREEGFNIWIDSDALRASDNWWESILKAIKIADAFIVIMTPEARESDWVQREVTLADKRKIPAFPLLLDGEEFEIYVLTQYIDVSDGQLPDDKYFHSLLKYSKQNTDYGNNIATSNILLEENEPEIEKTKNLVAVAGGEIYSLPFKRSDYIVTVLDMDSRVLPISKLTNGNVLYYPIQILNKHTNTSFVSSPRENKSISWLYVQAETILGTLKGWIPINQLGVILDAGIPTEATKLTTSLFEDNTLDQLLKLQSIYKIYNLIFYTSFIGSYTCLALAFFVLLFSQLAPISKITIFIGLLFIFYIFLKIFTYTREPILNMIDLNYLQEIIDIRKLEGVLET